MRRIDDCGHQRAVGLDPRLGATEFRLWRICQLDASGFQIHSHAIGNATVILYCSAGLWPDYDANSGRSRDCSGPALPIL